MAQPLSTDEIGRLHGASYSETLSYYSLLTHSMRRVRQEVQRVVLEGEESASNPICSIGPTSLSRQLLAPVAKNAKILDVGCGPGDNLALMRELGYRHLTGIDVAQRMISEAKNRVDAKWICADVFSSKAEADYDLVFAQAFVHLFPKHRLDEVFKRLLGLAKHRVYFSTTIHDVSTEGMEAKEHVTRYRSRYTLPELLGRIRSILKRDLSLSFHYFFLTDPLGRYWINGIFERRDMSADFQEDGALLYRQFLLPRDCSSVLTELEELRCKPAKPGSYLRYEAANGAFDRLENILPYCSRALAELLHGACARGLVSHLMGEEAVILKDKINFKPQGSGEFLPHQDAAAGWHKSGDKHVTMALALEDATPENGALHFALKQHKRGLLGALSRPLRREICEKLEWQRVLMKSGDALFFDAYAPHFSPPNVSSHSRRMAFLTYNSARCGDLRKDFFANKRKAQPPIDEQVDSSYLNR